jgi:hypothetical protein
MKVFSFPFPFSVSVGGLGSVYGEPRRFREFGFAYLGGWGGMIPVLEGLLCGVMDDHGWSMMPCWTRLLLAMEARNPWRLELVVEGDD